MTPRKVITLAELASVTGTLSIPAGSIITPAARDYANEKGIKFIDEVPASRSLDVDHARKKYSKQELASHIDHTNLAPAAAESDLTRLCDEAIAHGFATVCVNPTGVANCSRQLAGSGVRVCAVVGYPTGAHSTEFKSDEALLCAKDGALEVDMVANVRWLKESRDDAYHAELVAIRTRIGHGIIMKVIIEASLLTDEEIVRAGTMAAHAGSDFVKTSTGVYGNARVEDVRLLRRVLPAHMNIKAAGGIKTLDDCTTMLDAGACRIGTSSALSILSQI